MDSEKKVPKASVSRADGTPTDDGVADAQHVWNPGFVQRFPWIAFGALCFQLVAAAAVTAILLVSDNALVSGYTHEIHVHWKHWHKTWSVSLAPNVFLNIISTISSLLLTAAVAQGIAIAWWRRALKGGTVEQLHGQWSHGTSILGIFTSLKHFNTISLAALGTKMFVIDSTLLQKATSTSADENLVPIPTNVTGKVFQYLPVDFPSGVVTDHAGTAGLLTNDFSWVLYDYSTMAGKISIVPADYVPDTDLSERDSFTGCTGQCYGSIEAAGFYRDCSWYTEKVDFGNDRNLNETAPVHTILSTNFTMSWHTGSDNHTSILMDTTFFQQDEVGAHEYCPGLLNHTHCELRPAVRQYPIVFYNASDPNSTAAEDNGMWTRYDEYSTYVPGTLADISETPSESKPTMIGGVQLALNTLFGGSATVQWNATSQVFKYQSTGPGPQYSISSIKGDNASRVCGYYMDDPTTNMFVTLDELMLRASVRAAIYHKDTAPVQTIATDRYDVILRYHTDRRYLWAALAIMFVTLIAITPVFYGFWQLGRKVTLGPVEIACAFQAPALYHDPTAENTGEANDLLRAVGTRKVQYGARDGRLTMAEPAAVKELIEPRSPRLAFVNLRRE